MLYQVVKLHVVQYGEPDGLCVNAAKTAVGNCLFQWSSAEMVQKSHCICKLETYLYASWAITIEAEAFAVIWSFTEVP